MDAMFVADGPFAAQASAQIRRRSSPSLLQRTLSVVSPRLAAKVQTEDAQIIEGFPNVELNNLLLKLLGLEGLAAPNNGTDGFWDKYF